MGLIHAIKQWMVRTNAELLGVEKPEEPYKKVQVLVEPDRTMDPDRNFIVWADNEKSNLLMTVEGVIRVLPYSNTQYSVWLDPRYNKDLVIERIVEVLTVKEKPLECFYCDKPILPNDGDSLTGTLVEPSRFYYTMHVRCAKANRVDVCGGCMRIVSTEDIVDKTYHLCSKCVEATKLSKEEE
jgi:hypothetical protein